MVFEILTIFNKNHHGFHNSCNKFSTKKNIYRFFILKKNSKPQTRFFNNFSKKKKKFSTMFSQNYRIFNMIFELKYF